MSSYDIMEKGIRSQKELSILGCYLLVRKQYVFESVQLLQEYCVFQTNFFSASHIPNVWSSVLVNIDLLYKSYLLSQSNAMIIEKQQCLS